MNLSILFGWNFLTFSLPLLLALAIIIVCIVLIDVAMFGDDVPRWGDE